MDWVLGNVGFPIGGCTWIVDEKDPNILMPIGAVGELLFEGLVVARGYLEGKGGFIDTPSWLKKYR